MRSIPVRTLRRSRSTNGSFAKGVTRQYNIMNKEFMKPSTKIGAEASYKTMSETWLYWT